MRFRLWMWLLACLLISGLVLGQAAKDPAVEEAPVVERKGTETKPAAETPKAADDKSPKAGKTPPPLASKVAVITVHGTVDYGLQKSLDRRKNEAIDAGADLLIFQMDTWGGHLDAGIEIGDLINNVKIETKGRVQTVAYVHKKAISAGAMISLACREIVMRTGTTIGDCQAIMVDPQTRMMKEAPEKIQTTVRAIMRKYAQSNGYPEVVCEAMVNPRLEVHKVTARNGEVKYMTKEQFEALSTVDKEDAKKELVVPEGQLLTMTDSEAKTWDISRASVSGLDEVLNIYSTPDRSITRQETNWSEELVRFLNSPAVAGLLMMVGVLSLYVAFKTPGFGAPEATAIACFAILFLSKYMVGLATTLEVVIFAVGVLLLAVEIFVIPGFGVTGISGLICIVVSLILASQKFVIPETPFQVMTLVKNMAVVFGSMIGATIIFMVVLRFLPKTPFLRKLVLSTTQEVSEGYVVSSAGKRDMVGLAGVALTTLRPVGRAEIDGKPVIVMAESEFIERGEEVVVSKVDGNRIVVTKKT